MSYANKVKIFQADSMLSKGKKGENGKNALPSLVSNSIALQTNRILNTGSHPDGTIHTLLVQSWSLRTLENLFYNRQENNEQPAFFLSLFFF